MNNINLDAPNSANREKDFFVLFKKSLIEIKAQNITRNSNYISFQYIFPSREKFIVNLSNRFAVYFFHNIKNECKIKNNVPFLNGAA